MSSPADFFDPSARTSQARLGVAVELMRELSRYSDPAELSRVFARRMSQLYPTARQVTLSGRGLEPPRYRVTRFNLWPNPVDVWFSFALVRSLASDGGLSRLRLRRFFGP